MRTFVQPLNTRVPRACDNLKGYFNMKYAAHSHIVHSMPVEFSRLVKSRSPGDRDPEDAVEARYRMKDLLHRPVLRDEFRNKFLVFESRDECLQWYDQVPLEEKCMHEVVFGRLAQKLKFDVDAPAHKIDAISDVVMKNAIDHFWPGGREEKGMSPEEVEKELAGLLGLEDETNAEPLFKAEPTDEEKLAARRLEKIHTVVDMLIEAILDELDVAYFGVDDIYPSRSDLVVTDSSGTDGGRTVTDEITGAVTRTGPQKYSYHILTVPYHVEDNEEAREFTDHVLERIPAPLRVFIDPGVNKRTQNFRMAGSMKPGSGRYKIATPEIARVFGTATDVTPDDLFVRPAPGARILPRVYTDVQDSKGVAPPVFAADSPLLRAALQLAEAEGVTAGHAFTEARGTLLCFARHSPSRCRICNETHHRDNSLMLSLSAVEDGHGAPGRCRVIEHCRQNRGRGQIVGEVDVDPAELRILGIEVKQGRSKAAIAAKAAAADAAGNWLANRISSRISDICSARVDPHGALASEFENLPDERKTVYAQDTMRAYELCPTLAVLAQMKLGKTKATRAYINEYFPADGLEKKVVRFVTFRQTFSRSIADNFADFIVYNDVQGDLDHVRHPRLIVQVESLHRLKMPSRCEPIDLLILDEVESILAQFNSGLHKHFAAAFAMFQWMLRTAQHVLVMDANLSNRTYQVLEKMRPKYPAHFHWNKFARAAGDVYSFTPDQGIWLGALNGALQENKRVVIPTNSLAEARALEQGLRVEYPKKKVMLYSSETAPSERARHFGDVHKYWADLDVLIYTPTCSAGVSFELEHYDALFGMFCDVSCDVETCRQMLGRVRNLKTREHFICLRATGSTLPSTTSDLRRLIYDKRANLYRNCDDNAVAFSYADNGEIQYYESDYFHLWLENKCVENLSRNDFAHRFIDQVADTGAKIQLFPEDSPFAENASALLADHKAVKTKLQEQRNIAIANSEDIAQPEAISIREAMQGQQDVEPAKKLAYDKWCLRQSYDWNERPVDSEFVASYNNLESRRVYRNLRTICEGRSLAESLLNMRRKEVDQYAWTMNQRMPENIDSHESRDLMLDKSRYIYQSHCIAVWLLRICGFSSIVDRSRINESELEHRLRSCIPMMKRAVERIIFELEIPRPGLDRLSREPDRGAFLRGMLRFVNGVERRMYGIQLQRTTKREGGGAYKLGRSATGLLFVFSNEPDPDDTPGGPKPHIVSNLEIIEFDKTDLFLSDVFYEEGFAEKKVLNIQDADELDAVLEEAMEEANADALHELKHGPRPPPVARPPPADDLDSILLAAMEDAYQTTRHMRMPEVSEKIVQKRRAPRGGPPKLPPIVRAPAIKLATTRTVAPRKTLAA